jgi:hypothetical protein
VLDSPHARWQMPSPHVAPFGQLAQSVAHVSAFSPQDLSQCPSPQTQAVWQSAGQLSIVSPQSTSQRPSPHLQACAPPPALSPP